MSLAETRETGRRHRDAAVAANRKWNCRCRSCRFLRIGEPVGRPRIGGFPISVTLTQAQRDWLTEQIPPGGTLTAVIRGLVEAARKAKK